jgi:hypothetical protein
MYDDYEEQFYRHSKHHFALNEEDYHQLMHGESSAEGSLPEDCGPKPESDSVYQLVEEKQEKDEDVAG